MKKLKIAVIGAGRLGGFHAQKLAKNHDVALTAIVDPVPANRRRVAAECLCPELADYRDVLNCVDAVVIATPTAFHYKLAKEFLCANTHILVEKPVCLSSQEADELVELADSRNLVMQVGHVERFNPAFSATAPHISNPKYIETTRTSAFTFRSTDVGAVLDLMIHDIDLVLSLAQSPVKKVDAVGIKVVDKDEDIANARLHFESGCVANLSVSRASHETLRQMRIWSDRAIATIDFAARSSMIVSPSETLVNKRFHIDELSLDQVEYNRQNFAKEHLPCEQLHFDAVDALALEMHDFIDAIRTKRKPLVDGRAGRDALAVAEAVLDSIRSHWNSSGSDFSSDRLPQILPVRHSQPAAVSQANKLREAG